MIMDADSVIVPEFLETAMSRLEADPDLIAVGGVFYGEAGAGWWGSCSATSTRATSGTSPVASARCSSSRAPRR